MRTVWLEDISASYALTLRHWRERFLAAEPRLGELGYDRRFRRLWEIWLALSEAGFREARIMELQILFAKPSYSTLNFLLAGDGSTLPAASIAST
jgi:cyclopropane-fatty-acyl-phospholipid synthase